MGRQKEMHFSLLDNDRGGRAQKVQCQCHGRGLDREGGVGWGMFK